MAVTDYAPTPRHPNDVHPTLKRGLGTIAETVCLMATASAIWTSVGMVLIGSMLRHG
jgi:hypothetical protein